MNIYVWILVLILIAVITWNVYPPLRERLRGWSTIIEGALGTLLTYFGVFAEALEEGQLAGLIPDNLAMYVPAVLLAWVILKRIQTRSGIGSL